MIKVLVSLAAVALAGLSAPVFASDNLTGAQIIVRYDKSDLVTVSGRQAIARKIDFAVNRVCGDQVLGTKEEVEMIRDCKSTARSMAKAQLPVTVAENR